MTEDTNQLARQTILSLQGGQVVGTRSEICTRTPMSHDDSNLDIHAYT
jgi:hypothetical protein